MAEDEADDSIKMTMQSTINGAATFNTVAGPTKVTNAAWVKMVGAFTPSSIATALLLYIEGASATSSYYVDDFSIGLSNGGCTNPPDIRHRSSLSLRRTGDLWFAVGLHGAWDWAETFFYGVPDSGYQGPGHFLSPMFHGPKWLTGGSVGPEGSLVTLAVEMAMMGLVMLRFRVSPKTVQSS